MIEFVKRPRRQTTLVSHRRIWLSLCGLYRVVESRCRYGPRKGPQAIPIVWYAERKNQWGWEIISHHRKRGPAEKACQLLDRKHTPKPQTGAKDVKAN